MPCSILMFHLPSLMRLLPRLSGLIPDKVLTELTDLMGISDLKNPPKDDQQTALRLAHFLGQCAHESNYFQAVLENLQYSAPQLRRLFPKYFIDDATAEAYSLCKEKIASRIYAHRMGNGDEASGDGFRFRGRGYIQITGRNNYTAFSTWIGHDCVTDPDAIAHTYPLISALFFFDHAGLWDLCDQEVDHDTVAKITLRINGGYHGLSQRLNHVYSFFRTLYPQPLP